MEIIRGYRKTRTGIVTSDKMDKTVSRGHKDQGSPSPVWQDGKPHPQVSRLMTRRTPAAIGDTVKIMETRPISKDKRWRVVEIIEKAK